MFGVNFPPTRRDAAYRLVVGGVVVFLIYAGWFVSAQNTSYFYVDEGTKVVNQVDLISFWPDSGTNASSAITWDAWARAWLLAGLTVIGVAAWIGSIVVMCQVADFDREPPFKWKQTKGYLYFAAPVTVGFLAVVIFLVFW